MQPSVMAHTGYSFYCYDDTFYLVIKSASFYTKQLIHFNWAHPCAGFDLWGFCYHFKSTLITTRIVLDETGNEKVVRSKTKQSTAVEPPKGQAWAKTDQTKGELKGRSLKGDKPSEEQRN
ncbi:hypothetical protein HID58_032519 [Brassica napus]|uniref:Uncharacterized protein n=1 Tax=Brassica napus TaxID=3708 RepID=A0ABQ8BWR0_BRANA|nr:hypothetical protein HID58_032519 [Brassica napus]